MASHDVLSQFITKTAELLTLAKQEQWTELDLLWAEYLQLADQLHASSLDTARIKDHEHLVEDLTGLQLMHSELITRVSHWHSELGILLQSTNQAKKIIDTYR